MTAYFRFRDPATPRPTAEQRRERNLDHCENLIERGMGLARAASDRALDEIFTAPHVARIATSMAAEIDAWKDEARRRGPDYGKLFTHLSRSVRQTMLLEMFLAEGGIPEPAATGTTQRHDAPNPAPNPRPHRDCLRRETLESFDHALPAGPDGEVLVEEILMQIGQDLGIDLRNPATPADPAPTENPGRASTPSADRPAPKTTPKLSDRTTRHPDRRW